MATPPPSPPYSIGALEGALVAFLGAFFSTLAGVAIAVTGIGVPALEAAAIAGGGSFAIFLGYHQYQSS